MAGEYIVIWKDGNKMISTKIVAENDKELYKLAHLLQAAQLPISASKETYEKITRNLEDFGYKEEEIKELFSDSVDHKTEFMNMYKDIDADAEEIPHIVQITINDKLMYLDPSYLGNMENA